jgi:nitrate reductase gamma subunit
MFTLGGYILIIVFVLLLLHVLLLLPPLPLISGIGIACRANQPVFVCYASTGIKATLLTKPVLWRRSIIAWKRA